MRETWNNAREYKYTAKKLNSKNNLVTKLQLLHKMMQKKIKLN